MKFLLFCICFLLPQKEVQYLLHQCKQNKLTIEINEIYKHQVDELQKGNQDLFTITHPDSSVKYLINVIRTKSPITNYEYLKSEEYKNNFSDNNGVIEEVKEIQYTSFKGIRFLKRIVSPQRVFLSYSVCTIIGNDLLVITYNTIEKNFYKYEAEFNYSVNSIKFR